MSFAQTTTGCDFQQNSADACSSPLTGSTFAGGDGNLATSPTTYGTTDWQNVAGLNTGIDLTSGTADNSFGQGTKEDNPNVSVVTGSIPPNKSDLTRFYEASEFANSSNFLYLAWERTNILGSANFDFEINQSTQPDLTTTGAKTLVRNAGDLLVTFDFTNGGGRPTIGLLTWVTSGAASQCFSSNSVPCWGNQKNLGPTVAIASVNTDSVTDPIANTTLSGLTFGETAINLTGAGVFPAGTCSSFGSAFVRSRSSASFTAEIKDFVAPVPVQISNCGEVKIIKHTDPRGLNQSFSYTSTIPNPATGGTTPSCTSDSTPSSFSLNDSANTTADSTANTEDCTNVPAGSYTVTEGTEPANFTLKSLSCTATTGSSGAQDATTPAKANISIVPDGVVTCTYVNQASGAIQVTKTGKDKNCVTANTVISNGTCTGAATAALSGAKFTVNGTQKTTSSQGIACWDGLTIGSSYTVSEDVAPTGFAIDTNSKSVKVNNVASCTSGTPDGASFTDTPLTNISAGATAVLSGATRSTVTCKDAAGTQVATSGSTGTDPATASTTTGLAPGTYTCTIVIDP